jgi:undecaprenyl pyrophosphate synthase
VRLRVAGDASALPPALAAALAAAEMATSGGTALDLTVAINYSGRRVHLALMQPCINHN